MTELVSDLIIRRIVLFIFGLEIREYGGRDPSLWPRGNSMRKRWH
jgi:hypothetical protein